MSAYVLDASALLALFLGEPGSDEVLARIDGAAISAVNLSEVVSRLSDLGVDIEAVLYKMTQLRLVAVAFDQAQAVASARLRPSTRAAGLSLGDRACLALAEMRGQPALTADKAWASVSTNAKVQLIR